MKLIVSKTGSSHYFSAKLGWKEQFDPKEIEMLAAGAVPMLVVPMAVQGKKNNVIHYDITTYTTLDFYLTCILSREQFVELMDQFITLFRRMQALYLNYKNLVLDLNQIYVQLSDRSIHLIYLPLRDSKRECSIPGFFLQLAQKSSRSTYEQVALVNEIIAFLNRPAPFTINELEQLLHSKAKAVDAAQKEEDVQKFDSSKQNTFYQPPQMNTTKQAYYAIQNNTDSSQNQGGTVILGEAGGTVMLGESFAAKPQPKGYLIRTKTGECVEVRGLVFKVGKEYGKVDYCIADNPAISRLHMEILHHDGQWYVCDLNSTNKTYLNCCALTAREENRLEYGNSLRLGNEEFTFTEEGTV